MAGTLAEKLMKLDRGDMTAAKKMEVYAPTLSKKLGEKTMVTLHSLPGSLYSDIAGHSTNKSGNYEASRGYDAQAMLVADAIEGIDVKDEALQKHFGAATPKDLVKILFPGGELTKMAQIVGYLSGFVDAEDAGIETTDAEEDGINYKNVKN